MSGKRLAFVRGEDEVYLTEHDTDQERMYVALAEVGLTPTTGGGGWLGWDRPLTQAEYDFVVKAEQLARCATLGADRTTGEET